LPALSEIHHRYPKSYPTLPSNLLPDLARDNGMIEATPGGILVRMIDLEDPGKGEH
jgi:hypothetical protein